MCYHILCHWPTFVTRIALFKSKLYCSWVWHALALNDKTFPPLQHLLLLIANVWSSIFVCCILLILVYILGAGVKLVVHKVVTLIDGFRSGGDCIFLCLMSSHTIFCTYPKDFFHGSHFITSSVTCPLHICWPTIMSVYLILIIERHIAPSFYTCHFYWYFILFNESFVALCILIFLSILFATDFVYYYPFLSPISFTGKEY